MGFKRMGSGLTERNGCAVGWHHPRSPRSGLGLPQASALSRCRLENRRGDGCGLKWIGNGLTDRNGWPRPRPGYCPFPAKASRATNKHDPQMPHSATEASSTIPPIFNIFVLSDSVGWGVIQSISSLTLAENLPEIYHKDTKPQRKPENLFVAWCLCGY